MIDVILHQSDIDKIIPVVAEILKNDSRHSVAWIKEHFSLSSDEYNMIMELTMPFIRDHATQDYWATRYYQFRGKVENEIRRKSALPLDERMKTLMTNEKKTRTPQDQSREEVAFRNYAS